MRLIALEIPDEPAELAPWLERSLVGPDLASLVAELEAVHGEPVGAQPSVKGLIGRDLDAVLSDGLSSLPRSTLKQLLRNPRLLLELQELALISGSRYWDALVRQEAVEPDRQLVRGRKNLRKRIAAVARPIPKRTQWTRQPWFVSLATAATILLAVFAYQSTRPPLAWGWSKPGALPENLASGPYLARLAEEAGEWFNRRPDDRPALARRINEFRQGCSTLILADHKPLSPEDRQWLVGKCKEWAAKLDAHLNHLEAPGDPVQVRNEVDETVRRLIQALKDRAVRPV